MDLAAIILALALQSAMAADRKLGWVDEFDKPGAPDPAKWNYEQGWIRNNEAQFYTRARTENARIENGCLVIESHKEKFPNPDYKADGPPNSKNARQLADNTSASLTTKGIAAWKNGRSEVRAKIPQKP